jgi:hypothetical protein
VRMRQFECEDGLDRLLATGRVDHELRDLGGSARFTLGCQLRRIRRTGADLP